MASVVSSGTSPMSFDRLPSDFLDDGESWAFINANGINADGTSNPSSVGFLPSPDANSSLRSFGIIGRTGHTGPGSINGAQSQSGQSQIQPSPPAPSPLNLDQEPQPQFPITTFVDQTTFSTADPTLAFADQVIFPDPVVSPFLATSTPSDLGINTFAAASVVGTAGSLFEGRLFRTGEFAIDDHENQDFTPYLSQFSSIAPQAAPSSADPPNRIDRIGPSTTPIEIPTVIQHNANAGPWLPAGLGQDVTGGIFEFEPFVPQPTPVTPSTSSPAQSASPHSARSVASPSPISPLIKQERQGSSGAQQKVPTEALRNVKGSRVAKKRAAAPSDASSTTSSMVCNAGSSSSSSSSSNSGSSAGSSTNSKFVIMTPTTINAHAGKPNLFECFDAMRMTQRGRKGPLANATKENALQVRRVGACFCCHARKVKCDAERPCKNCKKLTHQVPQIVCWQFQDFLTILFPDMIREHFKKENMAKFLQENVVEFRVDGVERPCVAELSSGPRLAAVLRVPAKGFTAKKPDVLQHWRQDHKENGEVALVHGVAAPIGLEIESNAQREELRKLSREYIQAIVRDPQFALEMVAWQSIHERRFVPFEVLRIVQTYALRSQSEIVKKALNIYTTHYIISRQLTFTQSGLAKLVNVGLAPQSHQVQTPRLLNRQLKALLDEINMREVQLIFEAFSKSLKPKMRKEWAPCMAAFLVLTMFMEEVEVTADYFALSQNQINQNRGVKHEYNRLEVISLNREVENMPFKQFAYQFHQVYQTHPTDASAKSFNPLVDDSLLNENDLGDPAAAEMVKGLRRLLHYHDLANMTMEPILGNMESHPFPRDVGEDYFGRLLAKFLLSFTSLSYLLDPSC